MRFKKRILLGFFTLLTILCHTNSFSRSLTDSLRTLIAQNKNPLQTESLYLELAQSYLEKYPDSSLFYLKHISTLPVNKQSVSVQIKALNLRGEALQRLQKLPQAVSAYFAAIQLSEKHHDQKSLGSSYNGLGICYYNLNDFVRADKYLRLALQAKLNDNDFTYYTVVLTNLATLYLQNNEAPKAYRILKEAEQILTKRNENKYLAHIYNSLGAYYQITNRHTDSALYYYQQSLKYALQYSESLTIVSAYYNIGDYYFNKKNFSKALEVLNKAYKVNEERADDKYKIRILALYSDIYDSLKDYKNAYFYKKQEHELSQKIFTIESKKELGELDLKYQSIKKEREIQKQREELQKRKNQQQATFFIAILLLLVGVFISYFIIHKNKIKQHFEREKLKLFENIVHEIRTPLTLIHGPIQMLKDNVPEGLKRPIGLMEKNTQKLMVLINELLDASKLGKGKYNIEWLTGDIIKYLADAIDSFSLESSEKKINILFEPSHSSFLCVFPSNVLDKIVSNLVGNALKYCDNGCTIQIKADASSDTLKLNISDNGKGIPLKEQKKIFDRFYRGSYSLNTTGTGIGLSMVKELTELVQGKIEVISTQKGTTFDIHIPLKPLENQLPVSEVIDSSKPVLLLVEDEPDLAEFINLLLSKEFTVVSAPDGLKAAQRILDIIPDIVLSDIMMPHKDGITLLNEIKTNELTSHIPVILFSAKNAVESRLSGLRYGADVYISKPFSPQELELTIQNILTTIRRNKETYNSNLKSQKPFDERVKSTSHFINKIISFIISNLDNSSYSVHDLSNDMAVSRSQLHRKLTAMTGLSGTAFIKMVRLEKAKDLLQQNDLNITEIAYMCGFSSQSYFTKSFTEYFGQSPGKFSGRIEK